MLSFEEFIYVEKNNQIYAYPTLRNLLINSSYQASLMNDRETFKANQDLLKNLENFKISWTKKYEHAMVKRNYMQSPTYGQNMYLNYKCRLFERVRVKKENKKTEENEVKQEIVNKF